MSKRKILTMAMTIAMIAILAVGGTLAYFTDTDKATNVFTTSNVSIDLQENFVEESLLMPGMDVNKDAWIVNDGDQPAYVWVEILIPAALDDADDNSPQAPGLGNSLHMNFPGAYSVEYAQNTNANGKWYNKDMAQLWIHQHNADGVAYGYMGTETIDGVVYNKHIAFYKDILTKEASTSYCMDKVYMDKDVKQTETEGKYLLMDGVTEYDGTWEIIIRAYGIQAEGFDNVIDAWKAYDGAKPTDANFNESGDPGDE